MVLTPEQVGQLLRMIRQTEDIELTCEECLAELDRYAQGTRKGSTLDMTLEAVRKHLEACPFCDEEFKLILETLDAIEDS